MVFHPPVARTVASFWMNHHTAAQTPTGPTVFDIRGNITTFVCEGWSYQTVLTSYLTHGALAKQQRPGWKVLLTWIGYSSNANCARLFQDENNNVDCG